MGSLYRFLWVKFVQILTKSNENGLGLILLFTNVRLKDAFKDKIMRPKIDLSHYSTIILFITLFLSAFFFLG